MPATASGGSTQSPRPSLFVTTHWSVVLAAKDKTAPACAQALETLCQTYWYPLYAFVRGSGYSAQDAQDLTQGFFARLLARDYLRVVEPEKGRFRTFLRMALRRFLAHEWERARAQKRGGGRGWLSLDTALAEERFQAEGARALGPDQLYDRRWALTLLGEATARLGREYLGAGKAAELERLQPYLTAERGHIPYAELAAALRTTPGAARVALHRLRKRFRELFRQVVAETVADARELEAELRHILGALSAA